MFQTVESYIQLFMYLCPRAQHVASHAAGAAIRHSGVISMSAIMSSNRLLKGWESAALKRQGELSL
jgi:hypothetical protein